MERGAEIRLWLMDDEYTLEPVSAMTLIRAEAGGREMLGENAGEAGKILAAGAFVAAEALKKDGERVFSSGVEALKKLTAEEIMEIYGYYRAEPEKAAEFSEESREKGEKGPEYADRRDAPISEPESEAERTAPGEKTAEADKAPVRKQKPPEEQKAAEKLRRREKREVRRESAGYYPISGSSGRVYGMAGSMQSISDFFQRDCRRYDGAYERY